MGKALHYGAVACATLGVVVLIVALASSAWMIGCFSYDNIFKAMRESPQYSEELPANFDEGAAALSGMDMCVHLGLFKVTMKAGNLIDLSFGVHITSLPRAVFFGMAGLILAIVLSAVGAILLLVAAGGATDSYEGKGSVAKRTRAGMILLILAGCFGIVGMAAYSGGTAGTVHNPLMFMAQLGLSAGEAFQGMMGGQGLGGRGKRDVSLSGVPPEMRNMLNTMLEGMDPGYGYAFAIGWLSVVLLLIAGVIAAVAKARLVNQHYSGPTGMKA